MGKTFGFVGTVLYLAIGIVCLVYSVKDKNLHPQPNCGTFGRPPLREYLFGSGIAYTIIGGSLAFSSILACTVIGLIPLIIVAAFAGPFTLAWMIVGAVSLWRDGFDCETMNPPIWIVGMVTVIGSIVLVVNNIIMYKKSRDD